MNNSGELVVRIHSAMWNVFIFKPTLGRYGGGIFDFGETEVAPIDDGRKGSSVAKVPFSPERHYDYDRGWESVMS